MKKITFFATLLAMLVSSVQSAFADDAKWTGKGIKSVDAAVTSLSDLTDGYYLVRNVGHSTFLQEQGNGNLYLWNANNYSSDLASINNAFSGDATNMNSVVYLAKDSEDGTYTMQFKSGKYMPTFGDNNTSSNATAAKLTIAIYNEGESYFNLKDANNNYADGKGGDLHGQGNGAGNFVGWKELSGKNGNNSYQFYKVTLDDVFTVNYKYTVDGHVVLAVNNVPRLKGLAPSADAYPCLTITGYDKQTITESGDVVVNCTMALPVKASTVAAPKWYAVRMHTGKRMMVADAANSEVACNDVELSIPELPDANQWAFVGDDLFTSFKLYNKGTQKYLKTSEKNAISTLVDEAEATKFHVMATKIKDMENGFCISNGSWYLNFQNPNTGTDKAPKYDKPGVYGWHDNDQGSTCTIYTPESFPLNYAAPYVNVPEGAIGGPQYLETGANLNALKAAYNAVKAGATDENVKKLVDINKQIADSPVRILTEGYYRLVNCKDKNYLHINGTILKDQAGKEKAVGSVVYFKSTGTEGQYSVLVEGKYLGTVTRSQDINLGEEANKGTYTVTSNNFISLVHEVSTNNDTDYRYLHVNGGNAVGWEANTPASQWYIIPATDVEIDMTAQGDNTYASAYLPFSVSAVDGATAYVGALNADKNAIDMKGVSGVPANNGFVLVGNGSKATLTIGDAAAIEGVNALTGTNTGVTFADVTPRANYLVFGVNDNKVGFYTPSNSVPAIPANKAYINASALNINAVALNFGGNVTSINAATLINGENNAPIYDLSGRRVWAPVKGGLYIRNGKKIIK